MNKLIILLSIIIITSNQSCKDKNFGPVDPGNDPNFTILKNESGELRCFNKTVEVFGINIYAVPEVEDEKLLHAANVMAQYLDNDENGEIDNSLVLEKMIENNAFMVMWKKERDLNINPPNNWEGQDLGNDETNPNYVTNGKTGDFDATLEEVLHIITHVGYANAYPKIFGEYQGTSLADAMDIARGGQFTSIPNNYPDSAWFTYDDSTCDYSCMATEYLYWALTSLLGAQENRLDEIGHEWLLNTPESVQINDIAIFELLTNPIYKLPTNLPDGTYMH